MSITIKPVTTKKEMKQFICFNYELYKDSPYACPTYTPMCATRWTPRRTLRSSFAKHNPSLPSGKTRW